MSSLVENATIKIRRDSAANWTSNNPTPASGEWCIETDTGQVKIGDGSTAWNAKGYHIKNPESFDISASNKVYNLPAVKGGQKEIIKWSGGDGTYKLTFTTQGSDTIGGLAASVWEGEGEGIIVLSDNGGTDWIVENYNDILTGKTCIKAFDGTMKERGKTGASSSGTITFAKPFIFPPVVTYSFERSAGVAGDDFTITGVSASSFTFVSNATPTNYHWVAEDRWR